MEQTSQTAPQLNQNDGLGVLHPLEIELIKRIREKYRFGEVTLILHEGLPRKIKAVTIFEDLKLQLSTDS